MIYAYTYTTTSTTTNTIAEWIPLISTAEPRRVKQPTDAEICDAWAEVMQWRESNVAERDRYPPHSFSPPTGRAAWILVGRDLKITAEAYRFARERLLRAKVEASDAARRQAERDRFRVDVQHEDYA